MCLSVEEQYEQWYVRLWRNAYGNCYVLEPNFAPDPNNVDDAIDNLTNRYDSGGEKMTQTAIRPLKELAQS